MTGFSFDSVCEDERWGSEKDLDRLVEKACTAISAFVDQVPGKAQFTILFSNDAGLQELNRQWRGQDKPTNVLSFPSLQGANPEFANYIGDIALAFETIVREANEQGKSSEDHILHMIVHGILHLLGYDHEIEADAQTMENLERGILARAGVSDPYA